MADLYPIEPLGPKVDHSWNMIDKSLFKKKKMQRSSENGSLFVSTAL